MPQTSRFVITIRRRIGVISLLGLLATGSIAGGQLLLYPPPLETGTSSVMGRVMNAQSRQPAAGVEVTLTSFIGGVPRASSITTDATGVYAFDGIAEGSYHLFTGGRDYQSACYPNNTVDRCSQIELLRDEKRANVDFALVPNAIARGRIVDEDGSPIADATVRLSVETQRLPNGGFARLVSGRSVKTAADGAFELRGVTPGAWYIEASLPAAKDSLGLPVIFYPGVFHHDEARRIEFRPGAISDQLVIVVPATTGNVLNVRVAPGPLPIGDVRAALIRASPFVARSIALNDDGAGSISGLLPGRYFIAARGWIKNRAWAAFEIAAFVSPQLDVSLQMKPAGRITGKIVAQNGGLPPLDGLVVAAGWTDDDVEINPMTPDQVPVEADGSFNIEGLFGRRAMRLIGLPADWRVYAIRQGRTEVSGAINVPLDTTVDITIVLARR
jgi:hypothetical protein